MWAEITFLSSNQLSFIPGLDFCTTNFVAIEIDFAHCKWSCFLAVFDKQVNSKPQAWTDQCGRALARYLLLLPYYFTELLSSFLLWFDRVDAELAVGDNRKGKIFL